MTNKDNARINKLTMMEVDQTTHQDSIQQRLVCDASSPNANNRVYPTDVLKEVCIHPVMETEEDVVIFTEAQAKAAKAQGYRLDKILREEVSHKTKLNDHLAKHFNLVTTEDLKINDKSFRSYQSIGQIYIPGDNCNYGRILDAGIVEIMRQKLVPFDDTHFGLRVLGGDTVAIDLIYDHLNLHKRDALLSRVANDIVFPQTINGIKTKTCPKYVIDGRTEGGHSFMAREMKDDELIPLQHSIVIVSTCHGLMQLVYWGDVTLEKMKEDSVFYMLNDNLYHTVFDDGEPYHNYLVMDSVPDFIGRRGFTVGDPILPIRGFDIDYEAWGGMDWEKEDADLDSGHELGKKIKEENIEAARSAATGKTPASAIMKKLLRSKK